MALRGLFGLSLTWALMWIPLGWLAGILDALRWNQRIPWVPSPIDVAGPAIAGAVQGFLFGVVFHVVERRRTFANLSFLRMALWAVAVGSLIPGLFTILGDGAGLFAFLVFTGGNAICGITTLAIAQRARVQASDESTPHLAAPAPGGTAWAGAWKREGT